MGTVYRYGIVQLLTTQLHFRDIVYRWSVTSVQHVAIARALGTL